MIVVDASVLVPALGDDGEVGEHTRRRLRDERLSAPELIDLEVISALRRLSSSDQLSADRAGQAVDDLGELRLDRVPHRPLLPRCWELRHNLTAYDAAYAALAEILHVPLLTADRGLASAPGITCTVELLG